MRKVKALEILAAAIAAVPGTVFAFDEGATPFIRPQGIDRVTQHAAGSGLPTGIGRFSLYQPGPSFGGGPEADVTATWIGGDGDTWQVGTNWTGGQVPDGPNAVGIIDGLNDGGGIIINGGITLSELRLADPQIAVLAGPSAGGNGTITFTNAATINTTDFAMEAFPFTGKFFGTAIGVPAGTASPAQPVIIAGSAGLHVTGTDPNGGVAFRFNNAYTGNTTISGGQVVTVLDGATPDGALGTGNVVLNNGELWIGLNGELSRNIQVQAGGGTLLTGTAANTTQTFSGQISGSGNLAVNTAFGGTGVFTNTNPYTGNLNLMGAGTNVLTGNGAFASATSISNAGTLQIIRNGGDANVNRLPDAGSLNLSGGLRVENFDGTTLSETVGQTRLTGGTPAIIVNQGGFGSAGGVELNMGTLTRAYAGAGLEVRGTGLGSTPGNDVTTVRFSNGTSLLVSGVIPWTYVNAQDPFSVGVESNFTELATYGANGLTPISAAGGYSEDTLTPGANVRINSDTLDKTVNVASPVTINSLVLAPGFDGGGNGVNGITLSGGGTITITSGALLSATSGLTPSGAINSGIGNVINAPLNFGGAEAVLNAPGALTINGTISGTGGLTKTGLRTYFANGTMSNYTGVTRLTSFNRHKGNLLLGQPSAYGSDVSPIELIAADRVQNDPTLGATGISFVTFGPDAGQGETTMTRGLTLRAGGNGELISALIRNAGTGTFNMDGPIVVEGGADLVIQSLFANDMFSLGGNISGAGHVGTAQTVGNLTLEISGNNSYTGGFDHAGGTVIANSNTAFGTGLVTITGATAPLSSTTGARTFSNDMLVSGELQINGTNPMTFTGTTYMEGGLITVAPGNSLTFSGNVAHGDLFKQGAGTLVLSGNNALHGQINAGNGTTAGGMIVISNGNAVGSGAGVTAANAGENAIGLTGGITVPATETMVSRGDGIGGNGSLRSLSGVNTWGGGVLAVSQYNGSGTTNPTVLSSRTSLGADAGTELHVGGSVFTIDVGAVDTDAAPGGTVVFLANSIGVRKVGPGLVTVGSDPFVATRSNSATSSFQGSIIATGSLEVAAGTLRLSSGAQPSVANVSSISIAGGPGAPSAKLDVTTNAAVVDYEGASPIQDIKAYIAAAYANGAWTGNGITSSNANANNFAVGYAEGSNVLTYSGTPADALFLGSVVDDTSVLLRYTRYGDANLDGNVNLADFNRLAANFGLPAGGLWQQGDFDYNGVINLGDFNKLAANFGLAAAGPEVTPQDWSNLAAAVPEPSALGLAAVAGVGLLRRRRSR